MGEGRDILRAAARLLVVDRGASMAEIAAATGVGRTTLHRRYRGREDLIRAIAFDAVEECEAAIREARLEEGSVREAVGRLFAALIPVGERYHFLLAEAQLEDDPELDRAEERISEPMRALIRRGKADGTFRPDVPDAWVMNAMGALLFAAWEGVRDGDLAPKDTAWLVTETLLSGLAGGSA
jgi:AcrR family transcriptional regulator